MHKSLSLIPQIQFFIKPYQFFNLSLFCFLFLLPLLLLYFKSSDLTGAVANHPSLPASSPSPFKSTYTHLTKTQPYSINFITLPLKENKTKQSHQKFCTIQGTGLHSFVRPLSVWYQLTLCLTNKPTIVCYSHTESSLPSLINLFLFLPHCIFTRDLST